MKIKIVILAFLLCQTAVSQVVKKQFSIYFDKDKYIIPDSSQKSLIDFSTFIKNKKGVKIYLSGNTDNDADTQYNRILSENRTNAIKQVLIKNGVKENLVLTKWFGEEKPKFDNNTDIGKAKNRRVDIFYQYQHIQEIDSNSGPNLYHLLCTKKNTVQTFKINPNRDTIIKGNKNTLIEFKAGTFETKAKFVFIKLKEIYTIEEMIIENLTTTSNGDLLSSAGMVYLEANDGKNDLIAKQNYRIFFPTTHANDSNAIFNGQRENCDSFINWVSETSLPAPMEQPKFGECWHDLQEIYSVYDCKRCRFFFCRIGRVFHGISGLFSKSAHWENQKFRKENKLCKLRKKIMKVNNQLMKVNNQPQKFDKLNKKRNKLLVKDNRISEKINAINAKLDPNYTPQTNMARTSEDTAHMTDLGLFYTPSCDSMNYYFKQYGVNNYPDFMMAFYADLVKKNKLRNFTELQLFLLKEEKRRKAYNAKIKIANKTVELGDVQYIMSEASRLGWVNCDKYINEKRTGQINVILKPASNSQAFVIVPTDNAIFPLYAQNNIFTLTIPKRKNVIVYATKIIAGVIYVGYKKTTSDDDNVAISFKKVGYEELLQFIKDMLKPE